MKRLTVLLLSLLLLLPAAALAWEEPSTPLTVTLSYEPVEALAFGTIRRVSTREYFDNNIYDENLRSTVAQFESPCGFKLGLPADWTICHGRTEGAFAAWQSPDGSVHAELCHLALPFNSQWYSLFYMSDAVSYNSTLRYRNAYCDLDLLPRLTYIGIRDPQAQVDAYHINRMPHVMYLAADQRTLVLYEYDLGFCLTLWADEDAELSSETLLTEIASTLWYGWPGYLDAAE